MRERLKQSLEFVPGVMDEKSKILGVSAATLYSYLNGKTVPNLDFLENLKRSTNISLDWLLTGKGKIFETPSGVINLKYFDYILEKVLYYTELNTTYDKDGVPIVPLNERIAAKFTSYLYNILVEDNVKFEEYDKKLAILIPPLFRSSGDGWQELQRKMNSDKPREE